MREAGAAASSGLGPTLTPLITPPMYLLHRSGSVDGDLDQLAPRGVRGAGERRHEVALERAVEPGRELAGNSKVSHAVGPVGRDLDFHHGMVRNHGGQGFARGSVVEDEDARVVVAQQELLGRAQHPARLVPGDVHVLDELSVRHGRTGQRDGDERADDRVGRSGDDLLDAAAAEVDLVHPEVVARLRVLFLLEHLPHDDLRQVDKRQRLDLEAEPREHLGRVLGRDVCQIDEIAQPLVGDLHGRLELLQEAEVGFVEQADVVDVVLEHRHALDAESPGVAVPLGGVDPAVA